MQVLFKCPRCNKSVTVLDTSVGRWITCPACQMEFAAMLDEPAGADPVDYPAPKASKAPWVALVIGAVVILAVGAALLRANKEKGLRIKPETVRAGIVPAGQADSSEDDLLEKICRHPFWRVKVTREMLLQAVDEIRAKPANTLAYLDDRLRLAFIEGPNADNFRDFPGLTPAAFGKQPRWFRIDLEKFSKRPERTDIIALLPASLDRADFETP